MKIIVESILLLISTVVFVLFFNTLTVLSYPAGGIAVRTLFNVVILIVEKIKNNKEKKRKQKFYLSFLKPSVQNQLFVLGELHDNNFMTKIIETQELKSLREVFKNHKQLESFDLSKKHPKYNETWDEHLKNRIEYFTNFLKEFLTFHKDNFDNDIIEVMWKIIDSRLSRVYNNDKKSYVHYLGNHLSAYGKEYTDLFLELVELINKKTDNKVDFLEGFSDKKVG